MYKTKIGAKRARGLELVKRIHWKRNEKFKDTPVVTKAITKAKREYKGKQKVDETVAWVHYIAGMIKKKLWLNWALRTLTIIWSDHQKKQSLRPVYVGVITNLFLPSL